MLDMGDIELFNKSVKEIFTEIKDDKELVCLFSVLLNFMEVHNVDFSERQRVIKGFVVNPTGKVFDYSITWSTAKEGKDFFYFLSLRWCRYLFEFQTLYSHVYSKEQIVRELGDLITYRDGFSHPSKNHQKEMYENILKNYKKEIGRKNKKEIGRKNEDEIWF